MRFADERHIDNTVRRQETIALEYPLWDCCHLRSNLESSLSNGVDLLKLFLTTQLLLQLCSSIILHVLGS